MYIGPLAACFRIGRFEIALSAALLGFAGQAFGNNTQDAVDVLLAPWPARARLESNGIRPFAELTTETWGNVAGGLARGAWWNQLLDFGLELNTQQWGAWEGGKFVGQMHWVANSQRNSTFADYTGTVNPVSGIMASDHLRVFNLHYQQAWNEGAVVVKIGQLAVDDDFMLSSYTGLFANSAFGAMPSQVGNRLAGCCGFSPPFPMYSVAAPGVFLSIHPTESLCIQGGVYDGLPGQDTLDNHGFGWADQSHVEIGVFLESGYEYRIADHSATVRFGISHHTAEMESFSGSSVGETKQAVPNFYAVHDLELVRSEHGDTALGLFCRAGVTSDPNESMVAAYADAGLNWRAPITGRPEDLAGMAVSYTRLGRAFRESADLDSVASDQTAVELTYKAQVSRWLAVQGDLQFVFNALSSPGNGARSTAAVLGLRASVSF